MKSWFYEIIYDIRIHDRQYVIYDILGFQGLRFSSSLTNLLRQYKLQTPRHSSQRWPSRQHEINLKQS